MDFGILLGLIVLVSMIFILFILVIGQEDNPTQDFITKK